MSSAAIVDAHHHIWRLDAVPWLAGPPQPRIFGEYAAPIEKLWTSYERIVAVMQACCAPLSSAERGLVFGGTARRIYRFE